MQCSFFYTVQVQVQVQCNAFLRVLYFFFAEKLSLQTQVKRLIVGCVERVGRGQWDAAITANRSKLKK